MNHLETKPTSFQTQYPGPICTQSREMRDGWLYQIGAGTEIFNLRDLEVIDQDRVLTESQRQRVTDFLQQQAIHGNFWAPAVMETDLDTLLEAELPAPIVTPPLTSIDSPAYLVECYQRGQRYFGALSLVEVDLGWSNLPGIYLAGADLSGADLRGAELWGANLRYANLANSYLCGAKLAGANLRGANLVGANLRGAQLSEACLVGADLSNANLIKANLSAAELYGACLGKTNLSKSNLCQARGLNVAKREGANFTGALMPSGQTNHLAPVERAA